MAIASLTFPKVHLLASPVVDRDWPTFASVGCRQFANSKRAGTHSPFFALYFGSRLQWCTLSREELMFNPKARLASQWQCSVLMLQQHGLCASCTQPLQDKFEAHHRQHYSEGGATSLPNLELLCPACHRAKHSKR